MGIFDTLKQMGTPAGSAVQSGLGGANGGSFAQKQPMDAYQQKLQQRANPIMQGRPAMNSNQGAMQGAAQALGGMMQGRMNKSNPTAGQIPGQMGSRTQMAERMQQLKAQQAGSPIGGSYGQMIGKNPQLEQYRNTGQVAGQDMGWMDKPGALQMPMINTPPAGPSEQGYGVPALVPPGDMPKYEPTGGVQAGAANQVGMTSPYNESAQEGNPFAAMGIPTDVRGEPLQDMGSRDPREIRRMQMGKLSELQGGMAQPDVMPRGLGPSDNLTPYMGADNANPFGPMGSAPTGPYGGVVMDENGLEPRRGAR